MQREPHLNNAVLMARRDTAIPGGVGQGRNSFVAQAEHERYTHVGFQTPAVKP